jgi:hypothetical protein
MKNAGDAEARPRTIHVPASQGAPLVLAFGVTLLLAGLVTHVAVSLVGAVLLLAGAVGWFREVLPQERVEEVPLAPPSRRLMPPPRAELRLAVGESQHRARLPVEIHPYSAGVWGGIAGGIAMAALAVIHGLLAHGSPWYTINLLAAAGSATLSNAPLEVLKSFNAQGFVLAFGIHATLSILVGLLYAALLPMVPGHPAFWGGLVAPILWSGLLAATLFVINPALNARIEWLWFVASQIAFGLVAGFVVARSARIGVFQYVSFATPADVEKQDRR